MTKFQDKHRIESHRKPNWDYSGNGIYFITILTEHRECILGEIIKGKMILSDFGQIISEEWHESFRIRKELLLDEFIIMPNHLHALIKLEKQVSDTLVKTHGRASQESSNSEEVSGKEVKTHGRASHESNTSEGVSGKDVKTHGRASQKTDNDDDRDSNIIGETHVRASLPEVPDNNTSEKESENPVMAETHVRASLQNSSNQNITPINPKLVRKPKSISSFIGALKAASTTKLDDFIDENQLKIAKHNRYNKLWHTNYHDHIVRNEEEYWRIKTYIKNNPKNWVDDEFYSKLK